jgi:hypothetical protein
MAHAGSRCPNWRREVNDPRSSLAGAVSCWRPADQGRTNSPPAASEDAALEQSARSTVLDIADKQLRRRKALAGAVTVVTTAAATLVAGCGEAERTGGRPTNLAADLERIERDSEGPVYWLGSSFEGLPLTYAEASRAPAAPRPRSGRRRPAAPVPGPFFVYGECRGEGKGDSYHCAAPQVQLQHWPLASPARYPRHISCTRTTIRGVPAAQFDGFEVYVGRVLVRIYAPTQAQARRAAAALRSLDESVSSAEPLPPPQTDVGDALRRCALDSLEEKLHELAAHAAIPLLWVGRRFEGRALFRAEGDGPWARLLYGGCRTPDVAGTCWPPLTLELSRLDDFRPAGWHAVRAGSVRCTRMGIRGAEAALLASAHELVLFTGPVAVRLQGPDLSLLRRAAVALRPIARADAPARLPPPPPGLVDELKRACAG